MSRPDVIADLGLSGVFWGVSAITCVRNKLPDSLPVTRRLLLVFSCS